MSQKHEPKIERCCFCPSKEFSVRFIGAMNVGTCESCINRLIYERLLLMNVWPLVGAKG